MEGKDDQRHPRSGGPGRSGWFALPRALSTPLALESVQLQPPPVKTELTFSSTRSCRIWTLKGLWSSSWHHALWFLFLSLVIERFNQHSAHSDIWNLCPHIFFSDSCMLAFHQRGRRSGEASCILCWTVMGSGFHSLPLQQRWKHPKSCSLSCHHPHKLSRHSSHTAPSGCFYQTQNSDVGTGGCVTGNVGTEAYLIAAQH